MRQMMFSVFLQIVLWCFYIAVIFFSPEDRISAKIVLMLIFIYLGSVISYMIGKSKRFVIASFLFSILSFSFVGFFVYILLL